MKQPSVIELKIPAKNKTFADDVYNNLNEIKTNRAIFQLNTKFPSFCFCCSNSELKTFFPSLCYTFAASGFCLSTKCLKCKLTNHTPSKKGCEGGKRSLFILTMIIFGYEQKHNQREILEIL